MRSSCGATAAAARIVSARRRSTPSGWKAQYGSRASFSGGGSTRRPKGPGARLAVPAQEVAPRPPLFLPGDLLSEDRGDQRVDHGSGAGQSQARVGPCQLRDRAGGAAGGPSRRRALRSGLVPARERRRRPDPRPRQSRFRGFTWSRTVARPAGVRIARTTSLPTIRIWGSPGPRRRTAMVTSGFAPLASVNTCSSGTSGASIGALEAAGAVTRPSLEAVRAVARGLGPLDCFMNRQFPPWSAHDRTKSRGRARDPSSRCRKCHAHEQEQPPARGASQRRSAPPRRRF